MYNEKLAQRILEKLAAAFPDKPHLHELQAALPEYESLPLFEWLSAVDALRLVLTCINKSTDIESRNAKAHGSSSGVR